MKRFMYTVRDQNGMHARPAGRLSAFAKQFSSSVQVRCGERQADAKRLLSLMSLGATGGARLEFVVEGDDEATAAAALERFCTEDWGARS